MTIVIDPTKAITPRQLELLALYASGVGLRDIAARKFLTYRGVQDSLATAKDRVGAKSLPNLCAIAVEHRLLVRNGQGYKPVVFDGIVSE